MPYGHTRTIKKKQIKTKRIKQKQIKTIKTIIYIPMSKSAACKKKQRYVRARGEMSALLADYGCRTGRKRGFSHDQTDGKKRCYACGSVDHYAPDCPRTTSTTGATTSGSLTGSPNKPRAAKATEDVAKRYLNDVEGGYVVAKIACHAKLGSFWQVQGVQQLTGHKQTETGKGRKILYHARDLATDGGRFENRFESVFWAFWEYYCNKRR